MSVWYHKYFVALVWKIQLTWMNYVLRLPQAKTFWRFLQQHKAKVSGKKWIREKTGLSYDHWIATDYKFWKKLIFFSSYYDHTKKISCVIQ